MAITDRLMKDGGVDVVIDDYDLKEGQDVNVFMERLKHDESLHFCLILSDSAYAKKANERKKGVGTEAQIISKEIYDSVEQTRFVPVVMENDDQSKPCLPTFLESRKFIDFSSAEKRNQNWEKLVRLLHGKPARLKPEVGPAPSFLDEKVGFHFVALRTSLQLLRTSLMDGKPGVAVLRDEVLDNFVNEINEANNHVIGNHQADEMILPNWETLLRLQSPARDLLIDWMLTEAKIDAERAVIKSIIPLLETVIALPVPSEGSTVSPLIIDAMACLSYELALYAVACLIEVDAPKALNTLFLHPFPKRRSNEGKMVSGMAGFSHYSRLAETWNGKQTQKWISPLAQLFKDRASHAKIGFSKLVEAEALIFVFNVLKGNKWYPITAAYAERGPPFAWFMKAKSGSKPDRLALATDEMQWNIIRDSFINILQKLVDAGGWHVFRGGFDEYLSCMGFDDK